MTGPIARFRHGETAENIIRTIGGIIGAMTLTNGKRPVRVTVAKDVYDTLGTIPSGAGNEGHVEPIAEVPVIWSEKLPEGAFDIDEGVSEADVVEMPAVAIQFMPHADSKGNRHAGFVADAVPYAIVAVPKPDDTSVMVAFSGTPEQHAKLVRAVIKHAQQAGVIGPDGRFVVSPVAARRVIERPI